MSNNPRCLFCRLYQGHHKETIAKQKGEYCICNDCLEVMKWVKDILFGASTPDAGGEE